MKTAQTMRTRNTTSWLRRCLLVVVGLLALTIVVLPSGLVTPDASTSVGKLDWDLQHLVSSSDDQRVRVIVQSTSCLPDGVTQAVASRGAVLLDAPLRHQGGPMTSIAHRTRPADANPTPIKTKGTECD